MSSSDYYLQVTAWTVIVPIVTIYILIKMFQNQIRTMQRKVYAYVMSRLQVLHNKKLGKKKEALFHSLNEITDKLSRPLRIVEIGAGAGANFKYYPKESQILCVDPNPHFKQYLVSSASESGLLDRMEFVVGEGENMAGISNSSVDAVVATLVLCTVRDVRDTLTEIRRILKPGGKFYYLEHTAAEQGSWIACLQNFLSPLWMYIADNCHLNRKPWDLIEKAGFQNVSHDKFEVPVKNMYQRVSFLALFRPHLIGTATK